MKIKSKLFLLLVCSAFLFGMSRQTEVAPFLKPIVNDLKKNTEVPLFLPTYWDDWFDNVKHFPGVEYQATENEFDLYFFSMDKPYPPNSSIFKNLPEANRIGSLSGNKNRFPPLNRPNKFVSAKSESGIQLWKDMSFAPEVPEASLYGEHKNWHFQITGVGSKEATRKITKKLINVMNNTGWIRNIDIKQGRVTIQGTENAQTTDLYWETKDGYVYNFFYRGGVDETVKIVNNMNYIK